MYKEAKQTLVDLNTTKIYLLRVKKTKYGIRLKLVFSVNKQNTHYYSSFLRETLTHVKPINWLFKLDDYVTYLADNCKYELQENKPEFIHTHKSENSNLVYGYLLPSPHLNLLESKIEDLIEYKDTTLTLLANGLFVFQMCLDNTNTVRGVIKDLKRIKENKEVSKNFVIEASLLRAIKTLDINYD